MNVGQKVLLSLYLFNNQILMYAQMSK